MIQHNFDKQSKVLKVKFTCYYWLLEPPVYFNLISISVLLVEMLLIIDILCFIW